VEDAIERLIGFLDALDGDADREGDELQHGGDEHDGTEPDFDGEPSLGWTVDGVVAGADGVDRELDGSYVTVAARDGYRQAERRQANCDGMHVDVSHGLRIGPRRIRNLSETQERVLAPRIDHREVRI
jgi:hypothetical protein